MNQFRFGQLLEQTDLVCDYLDHFTRKGVLGLGMPLKERYRYELLKFAVYLADADGLIETSEVMYTRQILGVNAVAQDLWTLKQREQIPHGYRLEIPVPIKIAVDVDCKKENKSPYKRQCAQILLDVMTMFGQDFIQIHSGDPTDKSALAFQSYIIGVADYLANFRVYHAGDDKFYPIPELEELIAKGKLVLTPAQNAYPPAKATTGKKKEKKSEKSAFKEKLSLESCMSELDELIGLAPVKQEVHSLIDLLKIQKLRSAQGLKNPDTTRHMVFVGNPGTGKTTVARIVARIYCALGFLEKGHLVETDRSGLVKGYMGQTAIRTKEVIDEARGGVLFIDEAYSLTVGCAENDYGSEVVSTLIKAMEDYRNELVVIVAGYPELMKQFLSSNPGLRSRFNRVLKFQDYSPADQFDILQFMCGKHDYMIDENAGEPIREKLIEHWNNRGEDFANARDVRNMLEDAIMRQAVRLAENAGGEEIPADVLMKLIAEDFGC